MTEADDPFLWLEEVHGERALAWVRERNAETRADLEAEPGFADLRAGIRGVLDARDQIPQVSRHGDHFYTLWRDAQNPRGLWRRTTLASYRQAEPAWEIVLDLEIKPRDITIYAQLTLTNETAGLEINHIAFHETAGDPDANTRMLEQRLREARFVKTQASPLYG